MESIKEQLKKIRTENNLSYYRLMQKGFDQPFIKCLNQENKGGIQKNLLYSKYLRAEISIFNLKK